MQNAETVKQTTQTAHAAAVVAMDVVAAPGGIRVQLLEQGRRHRRGMAFPANAMGRAALRVFCTSLPFAIRIAVAGVGALELALALCRKSAHRVVIVARPGMDALRAVRSVWQQR